ncbi:MAG: diguanylate cyclase/phosphodiesterase [Bacillota bacterium]|nr:diguanylate cyclase/phosphodiesterase [Bacillota bacterium]
MRDIAGRKNAREIQNIQDMIDNRQLIAHYQQIISISRKMVIGIEGLIRGVNPYTDRLIAPKRLFHTAEEKKVSLELDRACREEILKDFGRVYSRNPEKMLFLNLNAAVLEDSIGSGYFLEQVEKYNIPSSHIVIEVSERYVVNDHTLKQFADVHKKHGFLVALDDVGTGFSNMDRILLVKPDIIKIDYSLVNNIQNDFYKQGIFKSFVILANKIGALIIAEGVETEEEAIQVLRLGGHMIQGFYLSMPGAMQELDKLYENDRIDLLSKKFKEYMNLQYKQKRNEHKKLVKVVRQAIDRLTGLSSSAFDSALSEIIAEHDELECVYILDRAGIQLSSTICDKAGGDKRENRFFYSAQRGTDHSMEKYYYPLVSTKQKRYTTEPYVSLATGNLCITISAVFENSEKNRCIFCADFTTDEDSYNIEVRSSGPHASTEVKSRIVNMIKEMNKDIFKDSLTGAFDRRYIKTRLPIDMKNYQPLSVILVDIDLFKKVNDTYGHLAGDLVLKEFVTLARQCLKNEESWIARYGGDEFLIVLDHADEAAADIVGEKIRSTCEEADVIYEDQVINFTISLGIHSASSPSGTVEELIGKADKNLYLAKKYGRNQSYANLSRQKID